jgi:flagellar hook assembly protein FlgD
VGARTEIHFQLPHAARVHLTIYDVQGRAIRELVRGELPAGFFQIGWDGRDRAGLAVSSGTYMYKLEAGSFRHARKMIVTR